MKKYLLLVLVVMFTFGLTACSSNSSVHEESKQTVDDTETPYEQLLKTLRDQIDINLDSGAPDMDVLQEDYELLLSLRTNEYIYKSMAYGYFTGDFETDHFEEIGKAVSEINKEMSEYFPEEDVGSYYMMCAKLAMSSMDRINLDDFLIGTKANPDIDAMWDAFFEEIFVLEHDVSKDSSTVASWKQWTGTIGDDPYFELMLSYPSTWDEFGVMVEPVEFEGDNGSLYILEFCLADFNATVFDIMLVVMPNSGDTFCINDADMGGALSGDVCKTLFQAIESGNEYRMDVLYSSTALYFDSDENRDADWTSEVGAYIEEVIDTITESFIASFTVG